MRRALLILEATEAAVFSERAATEGGHSTLLSPPGSALLGWAAAEGRYAVWITSNMAFDIFHSGKVRFSNALPLTDDGYAAYPMPQLLMEPKHAKGGVDRNRGMLVTNAIRVGRKPDDSGEMQYEALGKSMFVTPGGRVVAPMQGNRLRTAVEEEHAAEGRLFGYAHLEARQRYAATIEAEDGVLGDDDWQKLLAAFDGKMLRLGRALGTFYGGAYECKVIDNSPKELWPKRESLRGNEPMHVRVWALSDLALVDNFGTPCFAPTCRMLGLPDGGKFKGRDSAISVRRYAPWNSALDCGRSGRGSRDVERQVIAAGSVLTFTYDNGVTEEKAGPSVVGLWREAGLGRIWVNPELLRGNPGDCPQINLARDGAICKPKPPDTPRQPAASDDPLIQWLEAMKNWNANVVAQGGQR